MRSTLCDGNLSEFSKSKTRSPSHIIIDDKFCLKSLKGKHNSYNFYKGVDLSRAKWVHIYVKQVTEDDKEQELKLFPSFQDHQIAS